MTGSAGARRAGGRATEAVRRIERGLVGLEAAARMDTGKLARSYAPGKWTGLELLAHLADADLVTAYRFLKVIAEEGAPIVPFDQDRWVAELRGAERPAALSIATIAAARRSILHYLATLPGPVLGRETVHPEIGTMSALDLAESMAKHGLHHLGQLEALRDGRDWTKGT